ncbi:hypothetical protein C8F04DRAFT_1091278 [Mycena alexandri]|uniref:F-box domain-containing protein n=1 Tax=Mycena alexandri TaxID=1745969 RepID=A0AAD6X6W3_9AGAR|nr:hypothetical protein C8F04DRAFT_1091278 [Mycena alexandri]
MSIRAALVEQTAKTKGRTDADIRRLIAESELELASLECKCAEITLKSIECEAPLASSSLFEQRDRERITAAVLRHLVAPVRSLPVELLAEIFSLTIRDKEILFSARYKHFQDAYRVSHVCSEWQQITLCTPQLWTGTVAVTVEEAGADADGLKAWLARSDPLPVPVVLAGVWNLEAVHLPPVLEELLHVAPRWGILYLDGFLPPIFYQRLADCTLDSLEAANLVPLYSHDITNAISSLGVSPRLRKLDVNAAPSLRMPWAQLTELALTYGSASVSLDILAQCTNLVKLTLHADLLDDTGTDVTLPYLRVLRLTLRSERQTQLSPFLDFLATPALETCSISFISESISWTQAAFTAFLLRSPNITHLQLLWCPLSSNDLIAALVHATSLTHLELTGCHSLDDALPLALHYKVGTPPLVPLLHDFSLLYMSEALTEALVGGMLASRWRTDDELASSPIPLPVARWSHVVLTTAHTISFSQQFLDAMKELERQGLPVEVPDGH